MIIRNGVKRSIDWEKEGYEFVGEASDGEMCIRDRLTNCYTVVILPFLLAMQVCICLLYTSLLTGMVIVKTGIFPMIGTLALQIILQGVAYLICGGMPVSNLPATAKIIGQGYVGPIPFPVIIFVLVMIVATIVLNRTYIGRHFYAIGSNEEAARLSGINTAKLKVATYAIGGFLSGLAGLIMLARISSGQPTAGKNMEMDCLTAAVIGGVSLTGGEGRISTAVCGVLIIGVLSNGMTILNISEYYQLVIRGCIFLGAVCLDGIQKKLAGRKVKKVA